MASSRDLKFTVSLIDKTQKGFKSVRSNMLSMQKTLQQTQKSWMNIGTGAAGLWGVGKSLSTIIHPAREMNAARGELLSLLGEGGDKTLNIVQSQAMDFAEQYGKSATEFVRASYDIQSAIDGLSANNLAEFTNASAILATATKSDTSTITSYMGTMYGIFEQHANKIGKGQWVEQIAGQTASAVKMFKTTGDAMDQAFAGLGARATNYNISSGEQFAVLGQLQSTLKGSKAGTAYAGFLDALPKAEATLGISLSGVDGKALGMVEIIEKLKETLGTDLGTEQKGLLGQAFGKQAAGMLDLLWNKTDSLQANIHSLNQVTDMSQAKDMAAAIADPYEQLAQAGNNVRIVFAQALSGSLMPLISYMTGGANTIRRWTALFPNLTKVLGYFILGISGLMALMAAMTILTGVASLAWTGLTGIWMISKVASMGLFSSIGFIAKALTSMIPAVWGVATAFIAAFGWIPILIAAVIGAVGALWYYWDDFTSAIANTAWFQAIEEKFKYFTQLLTEFKNAVSDAWETVKNFGGGLFASAKETGSDAWGKTKNFFGLRSSINSEQQVEELNKHVPTAAASTDSNNIATMPSYMISNNRDQQSHQSTQIGAVNFNTQNTPDAMTINSYMTMVSP